MMYLYRIYRYLYLKKIPIIPNLLSKIGFLMFNSYVPASVTIGKGSKLAYGGIGMVIHERAVIGDNCVIGQGMTIGGRSKKYEVPRIGNNVYIGAGARILGDVVIGDEVIIGPNAVVLESIPNNSIAVGIPARIVKTGIKVADFV